MHRQRRHRQRRPPRLHQELTRLGTGTQPVSTEHDTEQSRNHHDRSTHRLRDRRLGREGEGGQGGRPQGVHHRRRHPSRNDPGNIDYESHEVEGRPGEFVIYERRETRAHLDAHLAAPRMRELVPQMLELIDGSIEDGIRLPRPFRPAPPRPLLIFS
ncbi:putative quinol monooxygenase [Streptomyces desertarenae]|uniref:Quinol monooxygenase n=1 Tax=Streptomyces desertarenae TaxID=2666184 RepID=A0ABW4PSX0_9ACTN